MKAHSIVRTALAAALLAVGSAGQPGAHVVMLKEPVFAQRRTLLDALAEAIRAGDRARARGLVAALERGARRAQQPLRKWIEARGGSVERHYWIVPGAAVRLPDGALDALVRRPDVARVVADREHAGQLDRATDANNHNADYVQTTLGMRGAGAVLALVDSGIDTDIDPGPRTVPHPAFDRSPPGTGTRIRGAVGIAVPGDAEDTNGHGSAVAAIAVAVNWNAVFGPSDDGFAPDAEVQSYKVTVANGLTASESAVCAAWQQVLADRATTPLLVALHSFDGSPDPSSPAQQALDEAALCGDILVVTSAGNDGQGPAPTADSQANLSGLSVGAVTTDVGQATPHQVVAFSSYGPLPGHGAMTFPDLVACGDSITSVQIDVAQGVTFNAGTSFAAPMVAGTALALRAADPTLSAIDTKALILNNLEDVSAANPGLGRFEYGTGMLRSDLAATAVTGGILQRGQLDASQGTTQATFAVQAQAGAHYAATLAWERATPGSAVWDDLDLEVVDPAGRTIAIADSPEDLYERVLFRAGSTGTHTLKVVGRGLTTTGSLRFALAFGVNSGGGRQAGSYTLLGAGCPGTAPAPAAGVVVPAGTQAAFGPARARAPFAEPAARVQTVYDASWLSNVTVDRIAFRRDEQQYDTPDHDLTLEILLGHTTRTASTLSSEFAQNVTGPMTQVVAPRIVRLLGTQGLPVGPEQFDLVIPLDQPFALASPAGDNLLMEIRLQSHSACPTACVGPQIIHFDAGRDPGAGRVVAIGSATAATGCIDDVALVVSFMAAGLPGTTPCLQASGRPQLGETFSVVLRGGLPGSIGALLHGFSDTAWLGVPLPLPLVGAPGCSVLVEGFVSIPVLIGADGTAVVDYPLPSAKVFSGSSFYNQYLLLDGTANALGITVSNAGRALIGG